METSRLYLYTVDAEGFYENCGWMVDDRVDSHGCPLVLMSRELVS